MYQPFFVNDYPQSMFELLMSPNDWFRSRVNPLWSNRPWNWNNWNSCNSWNTWNADRDANRFWNWNADRNYQFGSTIRRNRNRFQVNVDVHHFAPEEVCVKVADGFVVVCAKHEERQDEHGYVARYFTRRYALPEDCNPDLLESKLSSDGVLTVTAQNSSADVKSERAIPITLTGPIRKQMNEDNFQAVSNGSDK